jgi:hypothetical protein
MKMFEVKISDKVYMFELFNKRHCANDASQFIALVEATPLIFLIKLPSFKPNNPNNSIILDSEYLKLLASIQIGIKKF